jgi:hypothetical protein
MRYRVNFMARRGVNRDYDYLKVAIKRINSSTAVTNERKTRLDGDSERKRLLKVIEKNELYWGGACICIL